MCAMSRYGALVMVFFRLLRCSVGGLVGCCRIWCLRMCRLVEGVRRAFRGDMRGSRKVRIDGFSALRWM